MIYGDKSQPQRVKINRKTRINISHYITEDEFRAMRNEGKSIPQVCEIIGFPSTHQVFYKYALSQGWEIGDKVYGNNRQTTVNEDFFKSWTRESAWVYGWLLTDGFVDEKLGQIKIALKSIDEDALHKIKRVMGFTGDIGRHKRPDGRESVRLVVCRKSMVEDVFVLGGMARRDKTFNTSLPEIPDDLFWDFVRGVFEGDGCVRARDSLEIVIASATEYFLRDLQAKLEDYGVHTRLYTRPAGTSGSKHEMYTLSTKSNADALRWCFLMYKNTNSSLRLDRKFETFRNYIAGYYDRNRRSAPCINLIEQIRATIPECAPNETKLCA